MSGNNHKVEFENLSDGTLEVRYFDDYKDSSYRSWKLPKEIAAELISSWKKLRKNKNIHFHIKEKTKTCEFNMPNEKYIDIRKFDIRGRFKTTG